jgi:hypothetical protein
VRCFRADLQSAPERLWASFSSVLRPRCGVLPLDWDRRGRVTPAGTESQEAWPGAEPGCKSPGESRGEAPEGERAPYWRASAPGHRQAVTFAGAARKLVGCAFRRSASLFLPEANSFLALWLARLGRVTASRERSSLRAKRSNPGRLARLLRRFAPRNDEDASVRAKTLPSGGGETINACPSRLHVRTACVLSAHSRESGNPGWVPAFAGTSGGESGNYRGPS